MRGYRHVGNQRTPPGLSLKTHSWQVGTQSFDCCLETPECIMTQDRSVQRHPKSQDCPFKPSTPSPMLTKRTLPSFSPQIVKVLNLYTPVNEFEERVSVSFIRTIQVLDCTHVSLVQIYFRIILRSFLFISCIFYSL